MRAVDVVLATGGVGQCFAVTTNPTLSTGDGIALALKAGRRVRRPRVRAVPPHRVAPPVDAAPAPLGGAARRRRGAARHQRRTRSWPTCIPSPISRRATSWRARSTRRWRSTGADHLWLDATMIDDFPRRFPTIWAACQTADLDPRQDWLPVAPAAHYLSGGIVTDLDGATTLPHLWACGETACSGVHGANRLASNSLLDGLVFGQRVVTAIAAGKEGADSTGAMAGVLAASGDRSAARARSGRAAQGRSVSARSAAGRGAADDVGRLRSRALRHRTCAWPPTRSPTSRRCPTIFRRARSRPTKSSTSYAVSRAIVARRAGPRGVAWLAHAQRFSRNRRSVAGPARHPRRRRAPLRRAARPGARETS